MFHFVECPFDSDRGHHHSVHANHAVQLGRSFSLTRLTQHVGCDDALWRTMRTPWMQKPSGRRSACCSWLIAVSRSIACGHGVQARRGAIELLRGRVTCKNLGWYLASGALAAIPLWVALLATIREISKTRPDTPLSFL